MPTKLGRTRAVVGVPARGCLLIADISGYTAYVTSGPLEYAEDVLADVTATVAEHLRPVMRINKLEGDAVFGYALEGETDASMLLDAIEKCYFVFRRRLEGMSHATSCTCSACTKIPELDLKFVVHAGEFIRREAVAGEELTGPDVIVVHRLLKNSVDKKGYVLLTEDAVDQLGVDPATLGLEAHHEPYPDLGDLRGFVIDLEARFREEKERGRVFVEDSEASFAVEVMLAAPPALVWEYLTAPDKRVHWRGGRVDEATVGGRRCTGTTSVCVDGRSSVYEEILDWRPFDYFTEHRTLPRSGRIVLTTELESVNGGTRVRTRGGRPERNDRRPWPVGGRSVAREFRRGYERLAAMLDRKG
jgi:uncharacterized protein YndB with AHSA1/START domain